ncbi:MAG: adenylate kinase [Candidatus Nanohaloarchaea archaeon]
MGEVNILIGLSGVGKGTVLEEAMMISDQNYKIINYGDKMLETAKDQDLVDDRDEMKDLEVDTYREIQMDAAERIVEESENEDVIVETHAAIKSPYGYITGLPKWTIENLNPKKVIMLTAEPEEIYDRTMDDESRDREHEEVKGIREYQNVAREMAAAGCVLTGARLKTIENPDGQAEKTAEKLVKTLRG